jgi:acyl-[acyl-carrier-protein]-phospholipid O-acyltransferase/long-chain-fatty-acid--[acyl-carrier-protein] ligase
VVVGYPDELMGERVAAFVVLQGEFSLDMCREWFKKQGVARFKAPGRIVTLDHLPLLGSGKPDRAKLAKLAACDIPWSP